MDPIQVVKSRYDDVKAVDNAMLFVIAKSSNKNTVVYSYNAESVVLPCVISCVCVHCIYMK